MKWFGGSNIAAALIGFCVLSLVGGGNAEADFIWGTPTNLGPIVNTGSRDARPDISADGLAVYFNSDRSGGYGGHDLYVTTRATTDDDWGPPVNLGPNVNSSATDNEPDISADGLTLYFSSGGEIWVATRTTTEDDWGPRVKLGPTVNSSGSNYGPSISADGLELFFTSGRPGGYGDSDLWVTTRETTQDEWGEPVNLGPKINSSVQDQSPSISSDGLMLFFDCGPDEAGDWDLWVTRRATKSDPWGEPVNLGPAVNSSSWDCAPSVSDDGSTLVFWSSRPGGYGSSDVWQAPIIPIVNFNGDETVDIKDLLILIESWGQNDPAVDIGPTPLGDGIVDAADLEVFMAYWGQEADDPTLIAHWKLDETTGITANDNVASHNGTVIGVPAWQPDAGKADGALEFDGGTFIVTDLVLNPNDGPFSAFAWVKDGAAGQAILSQQAGDNWLVCDPATGALMTELRSAARSASALSSTTVITDGNWHRVGVTWDGSNCRLYVDDVLVAEDIQDGLAACAGKVLIGCGGKMTPETFWTGLIDDVRIYNRAVKP